MLRETDIARRPSSFSSSSNIRPSLVDSESTDSSYDLLGSFVPQIRGVGEYIPLIQSHLQEDQLSKWLTALHWIRSFDMRLHIRQLDEGVWEDLLRSLHEVHIESRTLTYIQDNRRTESPTSQSSFAQPDRESSSGHGDVSEPQDLQEALLDLYSLRTIAAEEGENVPNYDTLNLAERVLRAMYRVAPRPYAVYSMLEGDIAIDAHSPYGSKLVVICDASGSARCLLYIGDEFERREYHDPAEIPDKFIVDALNSTLSGETQH